MPNPQTVSDLLALSRWDSEGGAGPSGRQQHPMSDSEDTLDIAQLHGPDTPSQILRPPPCECPSKLRPSPSDVKMRQEAMIPISVMVVEDDALMGALIGEVLEAMGYVVCAIETTAASAVEAAARCKPDLMLVDVRLGVGSGVAAVGEILRDGFVPHVFYSGDISSLQASRPDAIAIQKPFRVSELVGAIDRALGSAAPKV